MALNVVLVSQKQSSQGIYLSWAPMEGVASHLVFVAARKLAPEELEAALLLSGTDECTVVKLGADATGIVDDCSAEGDPRFYGVAMTFSDGAPRSARFKASPDAAPAGALTLSSQGVKKSPPKPGPSAAAPSSNTGAYRIAPAKASPGGNTGMYKIGSEAGSAKPAAAKPVETKAPADGAMEERRRAQAAAREKSGAAAAPAAPSNEPVQPPSAFPLEESFDFHMKGGTQSWDGLRLYWEKEPRAAAFEILVSDHQIFHDELADALAGKADFTTCVAVGPSVLAVIDNITPREARGWYLVLARGRDGVRTPHPFQVGDAQESGRKVAPFVNPNRTGELRAEIEGMLGDAREQWERWKTEQDRGAQHEAIRLVQDALLIFPEHPAAVQLSGELG